MLPKKKIKKKKKKKKNISKLEKKRVEITQA